jgi:3-oxoacyl-[acyl-carrier protein] reductase
VVNNPGDAHPARPRVALVTGGSRNLGRAVSLELGRAGLAVAVNARSDTAGADEVSAEIRSSRGRSIAVTGDITDEAAVARMAGQVRAELGPVTVLVHCAAYRSPHRGVRELSVADWNRALAVALDGSFLTARAVLPDMKAARFGRIVLIGGPSAYLGLPLGSIHGAPSKAGMSGLVAALAQEFGPFGITANVVAPGTMATPANASYASSAGWNPIASSAAGRPVETGQVAVFVAYLASESSSAITGQTIRMDGGMVVQRSVTSRGHDQERLGHQR